jgi:hypothetical protein
VALNFCRSVEKGTDFRVKILIYIIYAILRCDYFHFLSFKLELEQFTLIVISKPRKPYEKRKLFQTRSYKNFKYSL